MVGTDMRMEMVVSDVPKHKKGCFGARAPRRGERTLERVGDPQEHSAARAQRLPEVRHFFCRCVGADLRVQALLSHSMFNSVR